MKIVKKPDLPEIHEQVLPRQSAMKKENINTQWSARRLAVSVRNSRSAENDTSVNSTTIPARPASPASENAQRASPTRH